MEYTKLIVRPLVTEKSTERSELGNEYAFEVLGSANKPEIKKAVEKLYDVKVVDVRTMNRKGKPRRTKKGETTTSQFKRAIVKLDENSKINLF